MADGGNLPIGPGIWGFIAFFVLAVALWFLVRNMNSRLRRMAYRDRERAQEDATRDGLGADATDASGTDASSTGPTDGPDASGGDGTDPQGPTR
ncbi:hypothetical protein [Intrasporangium sp. YIM S08009]|uniref:hypothetical protein n=1 Tax=Intrasporangium zincisolvens TaxID=3080018 RepID=UPI002B05D002|nr:hypothetical protein [Intrasporangium sp. YIM S08009]